MPTLAIASMSVGNDEDGALITFLGYRSRSPIGFKGVYNPPFILATIQKKQQEQSTMQTNSQHHMDWFHCINADTGERYHANETYILPKGKQVEGQLLFLVRSPPDHPEEPQDNYFSDKQRRFDLQLQFKLTEPLTRELWYGVELPQSLPALGKFRSFLLRTVINCIQLMNPNSFHCDLRTGTMAFSVTRSMDRLVRTASSNKKDLPKLGEAVYESSSSVSNRASHGSFDWSKTENDIYTASCFSAYFDFFQWQVLNMPALPAIDLRRLVGPQHFSFVVYCGKPGAEGTTKMLTLEVSNELKVPLGPFAAKVAS